MAVSIIDVAEDAGVSKMTVTRVMRGDSVREATRSRVLRSMRFSRTMFSVWERHDRCRKPA